MGTVVGHTADVLWSPGIAWLTERRWRMVRPRRVPPRDVTPARYVALVSWLRRSGAGRRAPLAWVPRSDFTHLDEGDSVSVRSAGVPACLVDQPAEQESG